MRLPLCAPHPKGFATSGVNPAFAERLDCDATRRFRLPPIETATLPGSGSGLRGPGRRPVGGSSREKHRIPFPFGRRSIHPDPSNFGAKGCGQLDSSGGRPVPPMEVELPTTAPMRFQDEGDAPKAGR